MKRIGITGGIASGKSLVGQVLESKGVPVTDTDKIVHQLLDGDSQIHAEIRKTFGEDVFVKSGEGESVDRKALGNIVFSNPEKRKFLESIIHPRVRQEVAKFFERHQEKPMAAALVPLLLESNLEPNYDEVWLIVATEEQQIERLMANRGMTREQALARIRSQMPLEEKKKRVSIQIDNTGTPEETRKQVEALIEARQPSA